MDTLENIVGIMTWECCLRCSFYDHMESECGYNIWDNLKNKYKQLYVMQTEIICKTFKEVKESE